VANDRGMPISDVPNPGQMSSKLLAEQRRRWLEGERISVEELSRSDGPSTVDNETVLDLIYQEVLLREQHGEHPGIEEYAKRFPQLTEELRIQFELDRAVQALQHFPVSIHKDRVTSDSTGIIGKNKDDPPPAATRSDGTHLPEVEGYEVLRRIGQGGTAVVFKARHLKLNRPVAIKMLRDHYGATASHVRRFLTEAQAAARLQHPHIVQIYEVGRHEGRPFLAYEFLDGGTLGEHTNGHPIEPRLAASLIETLARTLHFAHQHGVIHRDLKPGNILLHRITESGVRSQANPVIDVAAVLQRASGAFSGLQLKIADFGLAKVVLESGDLASHSDTKIGDILGTPAYMSPEQARGDIANLASATDTYALGAILYELLTGRPPFVGVQPLEVLNQVISDDPVRPSQLVRRIPGDIQTICMKCLAKSPGRRYASAADLADDLVRFLADQPILARRTSAIERSWRWCHRHPVTTMLTLSICTLLILITAVSSVYSLRLTHQLMLTSDAKSEEHKARVEGQYQLWESHLLRAEALQRSGRPGQRYEGLHAIDAAKTLGESIELDSSQVGRMRNATIACLAQPDLRVVHEWQHDRMFFSAVSVDQQQTLYAWHDGESAIRVFRSEDGAEVSRISNLPRNAIARLSPDGKKLAVLAETCRVFRIDTDVPQLVFESASSGDWGFAPDSWQLLGANGDGNLAVVNLHNGQTVHTLGSVRGLQEIAISPDGRQAALLVEDAVRVLELDTGKVSFQDEVPGGPGGSQHFAWHPNSQTLAIGQYSGEGIILWDVASGTKSTSFNHANGALSFCFSATGDLLLTYDAWGGNLRLWNVSSGELQLAKLDIVLAGISPDAMGGFRMLRTTEGHRNAILAIEHPRIYYTLPLIASPLRFASSLDLAYSTDGGLLALVSAGKVQLFDTVSMVPLDHLVIGSGFIQFEEDNSLLTLNQRGLNRWRCTDDTTSLLETNVHEVHNQILGPPEHIGASGAECDFAVSRSGKRIAIPNGDHALIWSADVAIPPKAIGRHTDIRSLSFSADGRQLATGGWDSGNVCIWDVDSGRLLHTIDQPSCCMVQFSPDGKWLVTNSADLTVWRTETWSRACQPDVPGQVIIGVRTCFTPDGRMLAVSDSTARIHLINPADGTEFATLTDPNQHIVSRMTFSPNGNQLAVASDANGGVFHVWDLAAIRDELHQRHLDLPSETLLASRFVRDSKELGHVRFVADERFTQLEAVQQIQRARLAAEEFDLRSARAAIARAIELQPNDALACNNLAWLLATGPLPLRDASTAITLARRASQDESMTSAERSLFLNTLGVALFRAGKIDEAVATLNRSLEIPPTESQPFDLFFLSMCHARRGDQTAARDFFDKAEALVDLHRHQMPITWRSELAQFAIESNSLLDTMSIEKNAADRDFQLQ